MRTKQRWSENMGQRLTMFSFVSRFFLNELSLAGRVFS